MRVKPELVNRLRAFTDKAGPSAKTEGRSFKAEVQRQRTAPVENITRAVDEDARRQAVWTHHSNRNARKEVTLNQANNLARYAPTIQECSRKYNVPVELICAVVLQESGGNARAVSSAGARGLMQLMPATAKRFGVTNSFDPQQNIEGGTKYLRFLMDKFNGDYKLALAGYNAGEGNVEKYGNKIPPFAETKNYVPSVLSYADSIWQILHQPTLVSSATLPAHAKKV